jgi:hypothetical protein
MIASYSHPRPWVTVFHRSLALLAALALLVAALPVAVPLEQQAAETTSPQLPSWGALPLSFVPNHGQINPAVAVQMRGPQGTVSFLPHEVVFAVPQVNETVRLQFAGSNATPSISGADLLPGTVNDLRGNGPAQWRTNIPTYGSIVYGSVRWDRPALRRHGRHAQRHLQCGGADDALAFNRTVHQELGDLLVRSDYVRFRQPSWRIQLQHSKQPIALPILSGLS